MASPVDERVVGDLVERHAIAGRVPIAQWDLAFHSERLVATRGDGLRLAFSREELAKNTDLLLGLVLRALVIREPAKGSITLTPPVTAALRRFLDPVLRDHIAAALKRRLRLSLPIGALVVLTSLPALGLPLDIGGLIFGGGLIAMALVSKLWTHRALFLVDAALWLVLATNNALRLAGGQSPALYGTFAALGVLFAIGSARIFGFYGQPPAR
ncbi:MAG: hypothetical protein HYV09_01510 [Deltaproteobacteria bacterium]|nr:hypothetical protein [Deltaproteobacteria bacterium]